MKVIVDTSGWYASVVARDIKNEAAEKFLRSHVLEMVVLEPVFAETIALLHRREGKKEALRNGETLLKLGVEFLNVEERHEAWGFYQKSGSTVSFVDCTIAVMAKKLHLPVFAFDRHFKDLGLKTVPI